MEIQVGMLVPSWGLSRGWNNGNYSSRPKDNITKAERAALRNLKNNTDLTILSADKGNATMILNTVDYKHKITSLLEGSVEVEITATTSSASCKTVEDVEIFQVLEESTIVVSQYFHLRKNKMVMNPTVTKMNNWMTILKQMKMEALVLEAQKLLIWSGLIP